MSTCNENLANLGAVRCFNKLGATRRPILVPLYDADGDLNEWANAAAFNKSSLQAKINATDIRDRIFPMELINNTEKTREEPKVETDDFDIDYLIRQGVKSFSAMIWGATYEYLQKLSKYNFRDDMGVIEVDVNGNILCKSSDGTKIQPIPIRSFNVDDVPPTSESVIKGRVSWKYAMEGNEYLALATIPAGDLDFNPLSKVDIYSLDDVVLEVTSPTTSGATLTAYVKDGGKKYPVYGIVAGDLTVLKGVTPVTPTITASAEGVYTITWTTTSGAHTITASKARYDFGTAVSFTIA